MHCNADDGNSKDTACLKSGKYSFSVFRLFASFDPSPSVN